MERTKCALCQRDRREAHEDIGNGQGHNLRRRSEPLTWSGSGQTTYAHRDWCRLSHPGISHIEPGSPWENPFVESFNGKLRDDLLDTEVFEILLEAQMLAEDIRIDYNTYRPHSSLGYLAPAKFAEQWRVREGRLSELVNSQSGAGQADYGGTLATRATAAIRVVFGNSKETKPDTTDPD